MNEQWAQNFRRIAVHGKTKYSQQSLSLIATFSTKLPTWSLFRVKNFRYKFFFFLSRWLISNVFLQIFSVSSRFSANLNIGANILKICFEVLGVLQIMLRIYFPSHPAALVHCLILWASVPLRHLPPPFLTLKLKFVYSFKIYSRSLVPSFAIRIWFHVDISSVRDNFFSAGFFRC